VISVWNGPGPASAPVEIVERKGLTHPDTLADAIALELMDNRGRPLRAETRLGQRVGAKTDIRNVAAADIVREAVSWGIRLPTAGAVVSDTIDAVISATHTLQGDQRVLATIRQHTEHIAGCE
jgi:serine/threonine-protein kinase HipA